MKNNEMGFEFEKAIKQYESLLADKQQQNRKLLSQIQQMKSSSHAKDRKILMLSQTISQINQQANQLKQQIGKKQSLLKSYSTNLYNKNVEVNKLQGSLKLKFDKQINEKEDEINQLKLIIKQQDKQINQLFNDISNILNTFDCASKRQQFQRQQLELLTNFNAELISQIEQVQNQNEKFIVEIVQLRNELQLQNQQAEDLMSQVEVMNTHIQATS